MCLFHLFMHVLLSLDLFVRLNWLIFTIATYLFGRDEHQLSVTSAIRYQILQVHSSTFI